MNDGQYIIRDFGGVLYVLLLPIRFDAQRLLLNLLGIKCHFIGVLWHLLRDGCSSRPLFLTLFAKKGLTNLKSVLYFHHCHNLGGGWKDNNMKPKNNTMYTWEDAYKNNWTLYRAFDDAADAWSYKNMPEHVILKKGVKSIYSKDAEVSPLNNIGDANGRTVYKYSQRIFNNYYLYYRQGERPGNNCHLPLGIIVNSRMSLRSFAECDFCEDSHIYGIVRLTDDYSQIKSKFQKRTLNYHYAYEGVKGETLRVYEQFQRMVQCDY